MRLIDADELLKVTVKRNGIWNAITNSSGEGLEEIINSQPTIGISDNATNGDVIKAVFGGMQINDPENENDLVYIEHLYFGFPKYWWDAPYKGGK